MYSEREEKSIRTTFHISFIALYLRYHLNRPRDRVLHAREDTQKHPRGPQKCPLLTDSHLACTPQTLQACPAAHQAHAKAAAGVQQGS